MNFPGFTSLPASLRKTGRGASRHLQSPKGGLNGLNEGKASILAPSLTVPKPQTLTTP
jgi:hypothetical protein